MKMKFPLIITLATLSLGPASIAAFAPHYSSSSSLVNMARGISSSSTSSATSLQISVLESLADITTFSIDSGDIDTVSHCAKTGLITNATTNPLFVSQAGANGDARSALPAVKTDVRCRKRR